jgi:hemerythrin-like domain-containing protein
MVEASKLDTQQFDKTDQSLKDFKGTQQQSFANDGLAYLKNDHRTVFNLYDTRFKLSSDIRAKREVMEEIITELSKHSAVEEMILYPIIRFSLDDGEKWYQESCKDHQQLKEDLQKILDIDPVDEKWLSIVDKVFSELREHIEMEENEIFPLLYKKLSKDQLGMLYSALDNGKIVAPTNPHPGTGSGIAQWFAGPVVGLFDKLKDSMGWKK